MVVQGLFGTYPGAPVGSKIESVQRGEVRRSEATGAPPSSLPQHSSSIDDEIAATLIQFKDACEASKAAWKKFNSGEACPLMNDDIKTASERVQTLMLKLVSLFQQRNTEQEQASALPVRGAAHPGTSEIAADLDTTEKSVPQRSALLARAQTR